MRVLAYKQLLQSYRSVTLDSMARSFGVSTAFIDAELSRFVAAGRLNCKIDMVSDPVASCVMLAGLDSPGWCYCCPRCLKPLLTWVATSPPLPSLLPYPCPAPAPASTISVNPRHGAAPWGGQVAGIVETNRPDVKNAQYQECIKTGDQLLNRLQKLGQRINI